MWLTAARAFSIVPVSCGIDNAAIFHGDNAVRDAEDTWIMRHKQDRGAAFSGKTLDQRRNLMPGGLVE